MKPFIIGAASDMGCHVDGARLGPSQAIQDLSLIFDGDLETEILMQDENFIKNNKPEERHKNEEAINQYTNNLHQIIYDKESSGYFPILVGGDHSVAVASALSSARIHGNIGIIWFDAHTDYNTFATTPTGNIHGMPLSTITAFHDDELVELREFSPNKTILPKNAVVFGARSVDDEEWPNVIESGITVYTMEDIRKRGFDNVLQEAFKVASNGTNGIHISYDLDLIDPEYAPGVSIPVPNGITKEEAFKINQEIINNIDKVVSYDLVEYNPPYDIDDKTRELATNLLVQTIEAVKTKQAVNNNKNVQKAI